MSYTIAQIKVAVPHWFSKGNMKFFNSRVESVAYNGRGGTYFVTSECYLSEPNEFHKRLYTVRKFVPTGVIDDDAHIKTIGSFQEYRRVEDARKSARLFAAK